MNFFLPSTSLAPTLSPSALYYEPILPQIKAPPGLPAFDKQDSYAVAQCARVAREKVEKTKNSVLRQATDPALADEVLFNRLPLYQSRAENSYRQGAIYCRSGGWLEILDDRAAHSKRRHRHQHNQTYEPEYVRGTRRETSGFAILEFISVAFGLISIRGLQSQNFLCMDYKGQIYAAPAKHYNSDCVFLEEMLENYYNLFSSCAHGSSADPWYLSIRKSGRTRRGNHTKRRHRSTHFIVVHFDETGLLDPVPPYLTQSAYRIQSNWIRHRWNEPMPPLERQNNPFAPAALFTSESRSLNDILTNSLNRWPTKKLQQNSRKESERLALQKRKEALKVANQVDETDHLNIESLLGEMSSAEKRVFRKERRRRRRLFKEEQLRELRRNQLQMLRNNAGKKQWHLTEQADSLEMQRIQCFIDSCQYLTNFNGIPYLRIKYVCVQVQNFYPNGYS
ncbi:hypothetical protein M3Y97_00875500 [Aphelenchoides bicaudatus]|nr:hypothetical protein M3Y97_00875500 [Aphelenchoides bicaudatus]